MQITIHHGHIDHRHGYDHHAATTREAFIAWAANYCREYWHEFFDKDNPEHAIPDADEDIVSTYFERSSEEGGGYGEYFHHDETTIELPQPYASAPELLQGCRLMLAAYAPARDESKFDRLHSAVQVAVSAVNQATV